jgi:hypothetical protein
MEWGQDQFRKAFRMLPGHRTVLVFRPKSALEDAIEFHAFTPLEALQCV